MKNPKTEQLLVLMKENPELEVIPLVDSDLLGDHPGWWMAQWDKAEVDRWLEYRERIYFMSRDYDQLVDDVCDEVFDQPSYIGLTGKELKKKVESMVNGWDWKKAIFVKIVPI